jgi:putative Mn2+ efflux pump MntP
VILKIAAFVIPLSFDTLAVAIALGLRRVAPLRPAIVFAFFEAFMPVVGLILGYFIGARFESIAAIAGGVVLLGVAAYIFKEFLEDDDESESMSFASIRGAMLAGVGISLDELAIGFPMGTIGVPIVETLVAVAVQAFVVTFAGIAIGKKLGEAFGKRAAKIALVCSAICFAALGAYLIAQRFIPNLPEI